MGIRGCRRRTAMMVAAALVAAGSVTSAAAAAPRARPPPQSVQAVAALPPGESGFFSLPGELAGKASGRPAAYGPHIDDQRALYWGFHYAPGDFATPTGRPAEPRPGVRLYRDPTGVPLVYGSTGYDVWYGVGYASAQDRLFEMDAIRRLAEGRLAALVGPSAVPGDVQARVLGYTSAEYARQFAALPAASQQAIRGYVAGVNAWLARTRLDPRLLPAEYALLSAVPARWSVEDTLAAGVLITRSVASAGGDEMANVAALRTLIRADGPVRGAQEFRDLFWTSDPKAVTTVPPAAGTFSNDPTPRGRRPAVFQRLAHWSLRLPAGLASGPGTGGYPVPAGPAVPSVGVGAAPGLPAPVQAGLQRAVASVEYWGAHLHGGSYQIAVAPTRTADHHALLESAPQLGWSYPSELWEVEVHGAGYDDRGITVPGLPVVGIGYGRTLGWALTTGNSKTVDSFVETTRPGRTAGAPRQYLHDGRWYPERCHRAVVRYRAASQGLPLGPPVQSVTVPVCATDHGRVVASAGALELTNQYAMWGHEVDTINGILQWDRARTFDQFRAGMAQVSWNENTLYADARGTIAYWHPGRYPVRSPLADQLFPSPGAGGYDWRGWLPFAAMPHVVNPAQGYLANWNTLPARGWHTEVSPGAFDHVQVITDRLAADPAMTRAALIGLDNTVGNSDARSLAYLPLLRALAAGHRPGTQGERAALELLAGWSGQAADRTAGVTAGNTDGPAATLFAAYVQALHRALFSPTQIQQSTLHRDVSLHLYNLTPLDNLALRVLDPASSGLPVAADYLHGRTAAQVQLAALRTAVAAVSRRFGSSSPDRWRRPHPRSTVCSLTGGVIGPCLTMPYEDRGSYIQILRL